MSGMTPEGKVKKKVRTTLDLMDAYWAMPMGTGFGHSGVPDFLICFQGKFIGIECKANGNKPTALQEKHLRDIREHGGVALIVDETNVDDLSNILKELTK